MRLGLIWLVATGCSFRLPDANPAGPSPDGPGPSGDTTPPPPPPDDAPFVTCTTSDAELVVCLEIEDPNNLGVDGSGRGHGATMANVVTLTRPVPAPSLAATLTSSSTFTIGDSPDFDFSAFTIAAWLNPSAAAPSNQEIGVLDLGSREAALVIDDQGRVLCYAKSTQTLWFRPGAVPPVDTWSFVACTYQAPTLCTYVMDAAGVAVDRSCGQTTDGAPLRTSSTAGVHVGTVVDAPSGPNGTPLTGGVDAIRVYQRGLSQAELCASGGVPGC